MIVSLSMLPLTLSNIHRPGYMCVSLIGILFFYSSRADNWLVMFVEKYVNAYFVFYLYEPPPMSETEFTVDVLSRIVVRPCLHPSAGWKR